MTSPAMTRAAMTRQKARRDGRPRAGGAYTGMTGREQLEPLGWPLVRLALVLVLGAIAPMLDTTIASVALHTLAGQFHVGVSSIQWVSTGYLLALAVTIPVSGWMTNRFGAKPVWIGSLVLFTVGSALSGLAWNFASLVSFRALQGAAAGLITPLVQTMLVRAAGREKLGRVITIVTIVSLFPPIAGPVVAGLILAKASWRWIFYVNVPICVAAIVLAWMFVPRPQARPQGQAAGRLDVTGFLLLSPALVAILYGLSRAATGNGFASAGVLVPLAVGVVLAAGYLSHSLRRPGRSLVDLRLFRIRSFAAPGGVLFFSGLSLYAAMFLLPLYYQELRGQDALAAGLLLAPQGLGALLSRPVGPIVDKIGARRVVLAGICLCALGTVPYIFAGAHTSEVLLGCALVVRGFGLSGANIAVVTGAFRDVPGPSVPDGATITRVLLQVGGSFGTAVLAVILVKAGGSTVTAFHVAFGWAVGLTALALIPALLMPAARPRRPGPATAATPQAQSARLDHRLRTCRRRRSPSSILGRGIFP
jgi:EmrB/QacA subfamily drug resistance transporter